MLLNPPLPKGLIEASYTAGYFGTFIAGAAVGAILASGTGYYYPPYYGYPVGGYPVYRPYAFTYGVGAYYNTYTGAYGVAHGVYGPYGGAAAGAAYNPYTGTYARGATAYGPYGSRSVGQAYNPYTGTYAATSRARVLMARGANRSYPMATDLPTPSITPMRTARRDGQGSQGGAAAAASTKYGNTAAAKTASGNMYATHDGNVYKNTGTGWSSYDNGNWNSVNSFEERSELPKLRCQPGRSSAAKAELSKLRCQSSRIPAARSRVRNGPINRRKAGVLELASGPEAQNQTRGEAQSQRFEASSGAEAASAAASVDSAAAVDLGVGVVSEEGLEVDDAKLHQM